MKYGYVIDSTVDLPAELIKKHSIGIVPLKVIWGKEEFLDGVNLTSEQFFVRLLSDKVQPRTSAPSPADFLKAYKEQLAKGCDHVVSVHISSKMSGTVQAAHMAASMIDKSRITVVDSMTVSIGAGIRMLDIIDFLARTDKPQQIMDYIIRTNSLMETYFVVDDLGYLHRGGRIGAAQMFVGQLLDVKPFLCIQDGQVAPREKIIGKQNVLKKIEKYFHGWKYGNRDMRFIAIAYSNNLPLAEELDRIARSYFPQVMLYMTQIGPVLGCHAGPGLLALAVL